MDHMIIYDTTLRDGSQTEGVSFSVNDKIKITEKLDELGIHYIEGGWPLNIKDKEFFKAMKKRKLKKSILTAFGSTRKIKTKAPEDTNLRALINSGTSTITIFGKSWDLHVTDVLKTSLEENCDMIFDSVSFLKKKKREIFYDAEHFFDGYKRNPEYALKTLLAAQDGGADAIVLCDTNGGTLPDEIRNIIIEIKSKVSAPLGIHTHNDLDLAVANSLAAIQSGCTQVQGTFNGLGERCGNLDLCTVIGILHTKLRINVLPSEKIKHLKETAYFLSEMSNTKLPDNHPFVGHTSFAHKGGVHIDAVIKNTHAYEHIDPQIVGNHRRFITSELAGKMPIILKAEQMDLRLDKKSPEVKKLLKALQAKEHHGYQFEAADASFELFMKRHLKKFESFFKLDSLKVTTEKRYDGKVYADASMRINIHGKIEFTASDGDGPVDALNKALMKALVKFYPNIDKMHLSDYKVRVLDTKSGTAAKVRVLIESQDEKDSWTTVGVHENIIEASWQALIDSIEYKLLKDNKKKKSHIVCS